MPTPESQAPANAHEFVIQTRWSDQDLLGHANNARILTYLEEARIRALNEWNTGVTSSGDENGDSGEAKNATPGIVLRAMDLQFMAPIYYPHEVTAKTWISHIGNTSFKVMQELSQQGQVVVTLDSTLVLFDTKAARPLRISDEQRAVLEQHSS